MCEYTPHTHMYTHIAKYKIIKSYCLALLVARNIYNIAAKFLCGVHLIFLITLSKTKYKNGFCYALDFILSYPLFPQLFISAHF